MSGGTEGVLSRAMLTVFAAQDVAAAAGRSPDAEAAG